MSVPLHRFLLVVHFGIRAPYFPARVIQLCPTYHNEPVNLTDELKEDKR